MARKTFYILGAASPDGSPHIYDDSVSNQRVRLSFCDKAEDLPSPAEDNDLAIIIKSRKFMFVKNGNWKELDGKEE